MVTEGLLQRIRPLLEANPEIRAILMECTELPHYSDALREATNRTRFGARAILVCLADALHSQATGLLVFDIVTCINSFMEVTTSRA